MYLAMWNKLFLMICYYIISFIEDINFEGKLQLIVPKKILAPFSCLRTEKMMIIVENLKLKSQVQFLGII